MGREERAEVRRPSVRGPRRFLLHAGQRVVDPIKACLGLLCLRHGPAYRQAAYRQPGLPGPRLRLTAPVGYAVAEVGANGLAVAVTHSAREAWGPRHIVVAQLS